MPASEEAAQPQPEPRRAPDHAAGHSSASIGWPADCFLSKIQENNQKACPLLRADFDL
jgi:hypothetical protein